MSNEPRIHQAIENWDANVAHLATIPDKKLAEKLEAINLQAAIAQGKNFATSSELLEVWWRQVVEARTYKAENNIPDSPNEIELAIADIETYVAIVEAHQEELGEFSQLEAKPSTKEPSNQESDIQLTLF